MIRTLAAACLLAALGPASAEDAPPPPSADPAIARLVAQVSPDRLRETVERLAGFGTRSTFSEGAASGGGASAARDWIADRLREVAAASDGRMTVALDEYAQPALGRRVPRDVVISSVVATLRGDEPGGRTYVMSAHYDSRDSDVADAERAAPGADDDASGVAAVLEAARILAGERLRATVIFAAYDAEEQGLFGSRHHAQALRAAGADVQGDLNDDIVGASAGDRGQSNPDRVRIFSESAPADGGENDSPSRELARFAHDAGALYVPGFDGQLVNRADRFLRGGDHMSFNAEGFAAIRFTEPVETFAHQHQDVRVEGGVQYGDLERFMDFGYLAQVARLNIAVLACLAAGPGRPAGAVMDARELTNDTTLRWSKTPGAVRYEVVRRRTTEPLWTAASDAGAGTTATLPHSKDDWLFGVRAVDADGHAGVPAFPAPER